MLATACHGALALAALYACYRFARLILPLLLLAVLLLTLSTVGRTILGL